jgi:hypothetical protein
MGSRRAVEEGTHYGVTARRLSTQIPAVLAMCLPLVAVLAQQPAKAGEEAVALARRTLAAKVSAAPEKLILVSVSPAQWRDSSLGCPERGLVYTPSLSSGFAIRLRDGEQEHVVHVAGGRAIVCPPQTRSKLSPTSTVSATLKAAENVRTALAARLGLDPARVDIESTFPAGSKSRPCAAAPETPAGAAFVVEAKAGGQSFRYYTDGAVTVSCDAAAPKPR